jgi:hypothetical protein
VVGEGRKQIERKASLSEGKIGLKLKNRSKDFFYKHLQNASLSLATALLQRRHRPILL